MDFETCMTFPIPEITRGYIMLRDKIKEVNAAHNEAMKPHTEQLEIYETALLKKLLDAGLNSAPNDYGTPYISSPETVKVTDWPAFHAWVEELQEPDFLTQSADPAKVKEWRDKHGTIPPGITITSINKLNVRR